MITFKEYVLLREEDCSWCGHQDAEHGTSLCKVCWDNVEKAAERKSRGMHATLCPVCQREIPLTEPTGKEDSRGYPTLPDGTQINQAYMCKDCMAKGWIWKYGELSRMANLGRQPWTVKGSF